MGVGIPKKEPDGLYDDKHSKKTIKCQICGTDVSEIEFSSHKKDELLRLNQSNIDLYKSQFFSEEIVNDMFCTIELYRNYLSILIHEGKLKDMEMLISKIRKKLKKLSKRNEEIIDFCIYYTLATGNCVKNELKKIISQKDYYAFCQLFSLLEMNLENASKYEKKIGKIESNFQNGVALLYSLVTNDSINIRYFNEKYNRMGILNAIINQLSEDKDYLGELSKLTNFPLIARRQNKRR